MAKARLHNLLQAPQLTLGCFFFICSLTACSSQSHLSTFSHQANQLKPSWIDAPPKTCRVGVSGPTMTPGHAVRIARRRGMARLVASAKAVKVKNASLDRATLTRDSYREVTTQTVISSMVGLRVNAMYRDTSTDRIYVLSCLGAAGRPARTASRKAPRWLAWNASPNCGVGQSYSAQSLEEQRNLAQADGAHLLAINLGAKIDSIVLDDSQGPDGMMDSVKITPLDKSVTQAQSVSVKWWHDKNGVGPLRFSGVLYARVCTSR